MKKSAKFEIVLRASAKAIASIIDKKDPCTNGKDFAETIFIAEALAAMGDDAPMINNCGPLPMSDFEFTLSLSTSILVKLLGMPPRDANNMFYTKALIAMGDD